MTGVVPTITARPTSPVCFASIPISPGTSTHPRVWALRVRPAPEFSRSMAMVRCDAAISSPKHSAICTTVVSAHTAPANPAPMQLASASLATCTAPICRCIRPTLTDIWSGFRCNLPLARASHVGLRMARQRSKARKAGDAVFAPCAAISAGGIAQRRRSHSLRRRRAWVGIHLATSALATNTWRNQSARQYTPSAAIRVGGVTHGRKPAAEKANSG